MAFKTYWDSFLAILFPPYCVACSQLLVRQEQFICSACQFHLPVLDHHFFPNNEVVKRLMGKVPLVYGLAYLKFSQSSIVQQILHQLKYQGRKDLAVYFGRLMGQQLVLGLADRPVDVIVPIALHRRKLKARGYNQSEFLAAGIAQILHVPLDSKSLIRHQDNASQTKFWGSERFENVEHAFSCIAKHLQGKHILLVDDVLTTGATVTAAATCLLQVPDTKLSVALLALA